MGKFHAPYEFYEKRMGKFQKITTCITYDYDGP
jgi:hypothetical protein